MILDISYYTIATTGENIHQCLIEMKDDREAYEANKRNHVITRMHIYLLSEKFLFYKNL